MFEPDKSIWDEIYSRNSDHNPFTCVKIYSHKKNFGNNGDKYLIGINCDGQPIKFIGRSEHYNNVDYDFITIPERDWLWFIIVGTQELLDLIDGFINFKGIDNGIDNL